MNKYGVNIVPGTYKSCINNVIEIEANEYNIDEGGHLIFYRFDNPDHPWEIESFAPNTWRSVWSISWPEDKE